MSITDAGFEHDVVVIGAGLSGIVSAQRYFQAHPDSRVTILEQDNCVGGVWSKRNVYLDFWSQWTYGVAEFGDMPMKKPPKEDCMHGHFRAEYTTKYLEDYVDTMNSAGRSLRDCILFNTRVRSVEKKGGRWSISCISSSGKTFTLFSKRLMVANGSLPTMPDLPGRANFQGTVLHSADYARSNVMADPFVRHISVIGAGKSSADMIYAAVKAGKTVSWIIRKSGSQGTGPAFFAPAGLPTPYENAGLAGQTRVMASLQPSFLGANTWWTRFLHSTGSGVRIIKWIFTTGDAAIRKRAAYRERKSSKGFEKLEYETDLFWNNGTGGVVHHEDFWPLVAENVCVYRASVKKLGEKEIYLDDDNASHFPCDAVLCGTGYQRGLDIFSTELLIRLGLPHPKDLEPRETAAKWEKLVFEADERVLRKFVILRNPPHHPHKLESKTPYRLYRGMAPISDDSIVFINHINIANKLFGAEAQAMWAVAWFDGNINVPEVQEREADIATWIAWCRRRYLSNGQLANTIVLDGVPYVDTLLKDMGVTAHLNKGWLYRFFAPFRPVDLRRAWGEYLGRNLR